MRPSSRLGQDRFTSTAATPARTAASLGAAEDCEEAVVDQLLELQRRASDLAMRDGQIAEDAFFSAEQNALLAAARFGIPIEGASIYTTMRPCFGCTKELLQARIQGVYYLHEWRHPNEELWRQYVMLQERFAAGVTHVNVPDPDAEWAVSSMREMDEDTGHSIPG